MKFTRIVPALVAGLAALPAAAHTIGVDHSHAALDSSLILGVVAALAVAGIFWAKNRG